MTEKSKTVVIAGASGFLGSYLAKKCRDAGYRVVGIGRRSSSHSYCHDEIIVEDLALASWPDIFSEYGPSTIFHLAATASVQASIQDPVGDFARVIPGTAKLVNDLARYSPETHLVFFSSAAVYGNPACLPIQENSVCAPISPYGMNKYVVERLLYAASHCYGIRSSSLRIFSAFGVGLRRQLFHDVHIKREAAQRDKKKIIELFGTGKESRDFIHAKDVANAALLIAESKGDKYSEYNLASGYECTIKEAVELYLDIAGGDIQVKFSGEARPGDPTRWVADVEKIKSMGYVQEVTLSEGLSEYFNWMNSL